MPQCKLCLKTDKKLAKSHIIPRSLYGSTLRCASGPAKIISSSATDFPKRSPAGEYDQCLLCETCEASLSPFDDYAHALFIARSPDDEIWHDGELLAYRYDNVEFGKLEMFFISLIWRMSATSRPMFGNLKLGSFENEFRKAVLRQDCKLVSGFDVVITKFDRTEVGVLGPSRLRLEQVNGYRFSFAGFSIWAKIDKREVPKEFDEIVMSTGDPLHMLATDFADSPEFHTMLSLVRKKSSGH